MLFSSKGAAHELAAANANTDLHNERHNQGKDHNGENKLPIDSGGLTFTVYSPNTFRLLAIAGEVPGGKMVQSRSRLQARPAHRQSQLRLTRAEKRTSAMRQKEESTMNSLKLDTIGLVVREHYGEDIWQAIKVAIAVIASLSLKGRDNCVVLVYEGASGRGKSITIRLVMPDRPSTEQFLSRQDDFTPAAFVSHAANRKKTQLEAIDLLPRIKNKVMLTKELAPLFRDDEKEQRQNFARLTSVLDGNGYTTSSGTHGTRGYTGSYLFNWLGATTSRA